MSNKQSNQRFAQFKLVLLGESAVGKSSIVHRFVKNTFDDMREIDYRCSIFNTNNNYTGIRDDD